MKPIKHTATLPDGRIVSRRSPRPYTHIVAGIHKSGKYTGQWCLVGWSQSEALAKARLKWASKFTLQPCVIPANPQEQ